MNLMDMVNGLERLDNEQPLSASAYKLAGKLIALCNSLYWKTEISIDLKRLACLASCSSTHTALKARNELVQRGMLTIIEEGCKGRPTRYKLADLSHFHAKNAQKDTCSAESAQNSWKNSAGSGAKFAPINKKYIFDNDISDEEVQRYRETLAAIEDAAKGIGLPFASADCLMAEQLMSEYSVEWVLAAINRAQDRNRTWGVVKGILRSWKEKGEIDDARNHQSNGGIRKAMHGTRGENRQYDMSGHYL